MQQNQSIKTQQNTLKNVNQIKGLRLKKELQFLDKHYKYQIDGDNIKIINALPRTLIITLPQQYPFAQPSYSYEQMTGPISQVIQYWSPKYKILEMISYITKNIQQKYSDQQILEKYSIYHLFKSKYFTHGMIILFSLMLRVLVGLGSYSGKKDWPQLGDFQAHRNWISITYSRPVQYWYHQEGNVNQIWWRIDYPPISAYFSYFCSFFLAKIQPSALMQQNGFQSAKLTAFMRITVIAAQFFCSYLFVVLLVKNRHQILQKICLFAVLIRPDIILIDHGHFQYNCISTGLITGGLYCLINKHYYFCCFLFTFALHTKQMSVYYACAFFSGLIGFTYQQYKHTFSKFVIQIIKYGVIVMFLTTIIWLPWLQSLQLAKEPFNAIFPVFRGLYQLKVPNFWCITDTFMNWQNHLSKPILMTICFITCFLLSLPSMIAMIKKPVQKVIYLGFINISMTFFMFAYHGHQKSIIFPLTVVTLLMVKQKQFLGSSQFCFDLIFSGCIGMFHLLVEDKLKLQFFLIMGLYYILGYQLVGIFKQLRKSSLSSLQKTQKLNIIQKIHFVIYENQFRKIFDISITIVLFICWGTISPPDKLPYLYNLLFAAYGFIKFSYSILLGNLLILNEFFNQISTQKRNE